MMSTFTRAKADSLRHGPVRKRAGGGIDFDDERYFSHAIGEHRRVGGAVSGADDQDFFSHKKRRPTHGDKPQPGRDPVERKR